MATKTKAKPKTAAKAVSVNGAASDILTLAEASQWLRVSVESLRREAESGSVPGRKIGEDWRFSASALRTWLERPGPHVRPGPPVWTDAVEREMNEELARLRKLRREGYPSRESEDEAA